MTRIKQLSPQEAQKIAAGEVVERPANVLKELIENALDAQATAITIYIEEAGKKLIRVIDNGTGMSREDAFMCIKHHATSKISSVNDLVFLQTFGFRGEALSSIASVSMMQLTTREAASDAGICLKIENGQVFEESTAACNSGTDIQIAQLFYNIPARKKFLKSKETEWHALVSLFSAFCLDYPTVTFKLFHENKLIYQCPAVALLADRLSQIYDKNLVQACLLFEADPSASLPTSLNSYAGHSRVSDFDVLDNRPASGERSAFAKHEVESTNSRIHESQINLRHNMNLKLTGALTDIQYTRYDRSQIFIFVNNRWVKNYKLTQALIKGYQKVLPTGKYPAAFLFITLNSEYLDINIHPRKEEVQFLHPKIVENFIETAVKKRLEQETSKKLGEPFDFRLRQGYDGRAVKTSAVTSDFAKASMGMKAIADTSSGEQDRQLKSQILTPAVEKEWEIVPSKLPATLQQHAAHLETTEPLYKHNQDSFFQALDTVFSKQATAANNTINMAVITENKKNTVLLQEPEQQQRVVPQLEYRLIGQLKTTYILIEIAEGLVLIDQHAAHERVLYEDLCKNFDHVPTIRLLFPQVITLNQHDIIILSPYLSLFTHFGVLIEQISSSELIVQETPIFLKNQSLDDLIKQVLACIREQQAIEHKELQKLVQEKIHAHISCKSAIKAGDLLTPEAMHELINNFYTLENRLTCPHGRPTLWLLSDLEITKKFKRDYR